MRKHVKNDNSELKTRCTITNREFQRKGVLCAYSISLNKQIKEESWNNG